MPLPGTAWLRRERRMHLWSRPPAFLFQVHVFDALLVILFRQDVLAGDRRSRECRLARARAVIAQRSTTP